MYTRRAAFLSLALLLTASTRSPQVGPAQPPESVGIDYPIVACKMPDNTSVNDAFQFPDGSNSSLQVGAEVDLVAILPNGMEKLLVDASVECERGQPGYPFPFASCVDPCVSFDGKSVYFSIFRDPRVDDATLPFAARERVPNAPAHIYRADIVTLTESQVSVNVTQLTFGTDVYLGDQAYPGETPLHKQYDVAPVELPDGRILFLSNRSNVMDIHNVRPAMRFYRMHADGSNIEPLENFTQVACQHPIVLMDGRIVWTHSHPAGRRGFNAEHPLMIASPDMSDFKTFAGDHYESTIFHFVTQLSPASPGAQGDIVACAYYPANNFGHGTLIRFPRHNPDPNEENVFKGVNDNNAGPAQVWTDQSASPYPNGNDHFQRVGERLVTPWSMGGALNTDSAAPFIPGTTIRAGKATMPAGAPDGHLLFIWSPDKVNRQAGGRPHMKIAFALNGFTTIMQGNMTVIAEAPVSHYMYPKPLVTYQRIYGIPEPAIIPDTSNSGVPSVLPAGGPFGTDGTSSVWNRESRWPATYVDQAGRLDPWDPAISGQGDYRLKMPFVSIGQDTRPFLDKEIFGVQVVADMSHVYTLNGTRMNGTTTPSFKSHNNGSQVWGILGEVPVIKPSDMGEPIKDPWGDPDTSFEVRVPADTPFHNRLIDENGLTLTSEQTWHSVRPGERKNNCGGCHAHSDAVEPRDFWDTHAGDPSSGYQVEDLALQTPLLRRVGGSTVFTHDPNEPNPRVKIVEWFRDILPIVQSKCATGSCHQGTSPPAELDLASPNAWDRLAYSPSTSTTGKLHPSFRTTQVTRYVRKHSAAQSLLVWSVFGARLDGRDNGTRPAPADDIDFDPAKQTMPPAGSTPLTFDEKRLFAMWIDLGCLVDLTPAGPGQQNDPFDDQMKPTLTVSGIDAGRTTSVATTLTIGVYDLHSGVKPDSLEVRFEGGPDLANNVVTDGSIVNVTLTPALQRGQSYTIEVAVSDNAGNVSRRKITTTPLDAATTTVIGPGSANASGAIPSLQFPKPPRIGAADFGVNLHHLPNSLAIQFVSLVEETPPLQLAPGAFSFLHDPVILMTASTDSQGNLFAPYPIPDNLALTGLEVHFQGLVADPGGASIFGVPAVVSPGMTTTVGW